MVTINIYLSTLERLKADPNDYDSTFPSSSRPFTANTEKGSYRIPLGWTYGDTARINTFNVTYSGNPYYLEMIQAYDAIKAIKVTDGVPEQVFLGCRPTFKRTIDKADWVEVQASYSDYSSDFSTVVFSNDEDWSMSIVGENGYKVCDPSDPSKSMVHYLFSLLNTDNLFTLACTYRDTTIVQYMKFKGKQPVLDVFAKFLKHNGLAYYVDLNTVRIVDTLEQKTSPATVISDIESKGRIEQKPYIKRTVPYIRRPTVTTFRDKEVYNSGLIWYTGTLPHWYPSELPKPQWATAECRYTDLGENQSVADYANRVYRFEPQYSDIPNIFFKDEGYEEGGEVVYPEHTGSHTGPVYKNSLEYKCEMNRGPKAGYFRLTIRADVVALDYNQLTKVPADQWDGTEERAEYIFTEAGATRYIKSLMYAKDMSAKKYHFYTDQKLEVDSLAVIHNVTTQGEIVAGEYIRIVTREDNLDEFGGYTYTGVAYKSTSVTTDGQFLGVTYVPPESPYDFDLYASTNNIDTTADSIPIANQKIKITIAMKEYIGTPTLTIGGVIVTPTRDTNPNDSTAYLDSYSYVYNVPIIATGESVIVTATLLGNSKNLVLSRVIKPTNAIPDIAVPSGKIRVKQYCYGTEEGPAPRWVEDASYLLEDATDLVADIYWMDEAYGKCPLAPKSGYYIWMRQGTYDPDTETKPSTWTVSLYDTPILRFNFHTSASTYIKNDRSPLANDNEIYIYRDVFGYDISALVVTASNKSNPLQYDATNQRYTLAFDSNGAPNNGITITATLGEMSWSEKLDCDDQTEYSLNLGAISAFPSNYVPVSGDYFVCSGAFGNFTYATPYIYDGISWSPMSINTADAQKLITLLSTAIKGGITITQGTALWQWIENFVAQNALIENLFAQHITILDNGCIHSEYYDDDGNPKLTATISKVGSGFSVALDIETFLISCGNIAGTYKWVCDDTNSFWDRATGNPLSSKTTAGMADYGITITGNPIKYNEITVTVHPDVGMGFWLGANGELKCENAQVRGDIKADSFAFGNVGLKWGYIEIDSTTTIDLITEYGMTYDDMVSIQASWIGNSAEPFAVMNFSFPLSDGARGLNCETLLVDSNGVKIYYVRGVPATVIGGIRVETSKSVKLFIQAFHNTLRPL